MVLHDSLPCWAPGAGMSRCARCAANFARDLELPHARRDSGRRYRCASVMPLTGQHAGRIAASATFCADAPFRIASIAG